VDERAEDQGNKLQTAGAAALVLYYNCCLFRPPASTNFCV